MELLFSDQAFRSHTGAGTVGIKVANRKQNTLHAEEKISVNCILKYFPQEQKMTLHANCLLNVDKLIFWERNYHQFDKVMELLLLN